MSLREEIKSQIIGALAGATFPIGSPEEFLAALPNGAGTTCRSGDFSVTAGEAAKLLRPEDFPFADAEQLAETIVSRAGL